MPTVAVTGACGYIGRHVVTRLRELGATVIGVDIQADDSVECDTWVEANILLPDLDVLTLFPKVPDVCLHLAWRNGFNHNAETHMANLSAHYSFLMRMVNAGVKQLAVMGSMHEVGYWEGPIDESTPCNPQSLYGVAKDALRRAMLFEASRSHFDLQWLRGFYIYGDDACSQSIFGKLLRAAESGEKTFPFTTGRNKFDFLNVSVLADMIAHVVMQDKITGVINCCSGVPVSLAERVEGYISENNLDIALDYGAYPDRPYDSPGLWGDPTKINKILADGTMGS